MLSALGSIAETANPVFVLAHPAFLWWWERNLGHLSEV